MYRLSLRNKRLKLEISGELPINIEESIAYSSNEWKQNRKMSTCNRLDLDSKHLVRSIHFRLFVWIATIMLDIITTISTTTSCCQLWVAFMEDIWGCSMSFEKTRIVRSYSTSLPILRQNFPSYTEVLRSWNASLRLSPGSSVVRGESEGIRLHVREA